MKEKQVPARVVRVFADAWQELFAWSKGCSCPDSDGLGIADKDTIWNRTESAMLRCSLGHQHLRYGDMGSLVQESYAVQRCECDAAMDGQDALIAISRAQSAYEADKENGLP